MRPYQDGSSVFLSPLKSWIIYVAYEVLSSLGYESSKQLAVLRKGGLFFHSILMYDLSMSNK